MQHTVHIPTFLKTHTLAINYIVFFLFNVIICNYSNIVSLLSSPETQNQDKLPQECYRACLNKDQRARDPCQTTYERQTFPTYNTNHPQISGSHHYNSTPPPKWLPQLRLPPHTPARSSTKSQLFESKIQATQEVPTQHQPNASPMKPPLLQQKVGADTPSATQLTATLQVPHTRGEMLEEQPAPSTPTSPTIKTWPNHHPNTEDRLPKFITGQQRQNIPTPTQLNTTKYLQPLKMPHVTSRHPEQQAQTKNEMRRRMQDTSSATLHKTLVLHKERALQRRWQFLPTTSTALQSMERYAKHKQVSTLHFHPQLSKPHGKTIALFHRTPQVESHNAPNTISHDGRLSPSHMILGETTHPAAPHPTANWHQDNPSGINTGHKRTPVNPIVLSFLFDNPLVFSYLYVSPQGRQVCRERGRASLVETALCGVQLREAAIVQTPKGSSPRSNNNAGEKRGIQGQSRRENPSSKRVETERRRLPRTKAESQSRRLTQTSSRPAQAINPRVSTTPQHHNTKA